MKALLEWLWSGCWHRWATVDTVKTRHVRVLDDRSTKDEWTSTDYILRCEKCGDMARRNLKPTR